MDRRAMEWELTGSGRPGEVCRSRETRQRVLEEEGNLSI